MCLDDQILSTYVDGELVEPWKTRVEEHLGYCTGCRNRCNELILMSKKIKDAVLSDTEIESRKKKVFSVLEKNCFSKKKSGFFNKIYRLTFKQLAGGVSAAAFVIVFVGAWAFVGNRSNPGIIPVPEISSSVDFNSIKYVSDIPQLSSPSSKTLDDFTLDEILKNLDARGYDVDIRLKSIQPVIFDSQQVQGQEQHVQVQEHVQEQEPAHEQVSEIPEGGMAEETGD